MKTLLLQFITTKTTQYIEPTREGTAKGEPIGFSSTKYKSALLYLTNLKGKEIAETVGVSYGLLRVWRTEQPYLDVIESHTKTFAEIVNKYIIESLETDKKKLRESGLYNTERLFNDFADIALYSDSLMNEIYTLLTTCSIYDQTAFQIYLPVIGFMFGMRKDIFKSKHPERPWYMVTASMHDFLEAIQRPWTPDSKKQEQTKVSFLKAI